MAPTDASGLKVGNRIAAVPTMGGWWWGSKVVMLWRLGGCSSVFAVHQCPPSRCPHQGRHGVRERRLDLTGGDRWAGSGWDGMARIELTIVLLHVCWATCGARPNMPIGSERRGRNSRGRYRRGGHLLGDFPFVGRKPIDLASRQTERRRRRAAPLPGIETSHPDESRSHCCPVHNVLIVGPK